MRARSALVSIGIGVLASLLIAASAQAVPPANDTAAGAQVIANTPLPSVSTTVPDITDATTTGDPPTPSCQPSVSRSVWYSFTPAASGRFNLSVAAEAPTATTVDDTVLAVYTSAGGAGGPFTELPTNPSVTDGCDDDSAATEPLQSTLTTNLIGGTQYWVVVWKFDPPPPTAGNTAVQVRVSAIAGPPPTEEIPASASPLQLNLPAAVSTVGEANDYQLSGTGCFNGAGQTPSIASGPDVVYKFTAPAAGLYSFRTLGNASAPDTVLYAASGLPIGAPPQTVGSCLAAANRTIAGQHDEEVRLMMSAEQTVAVVVDSPSATTGNLRLLVEQTVSEVEANETPATANSLTCGNSGAITPAGDVDFWSLGSPAAGSRVFAMADGAASDITDYDLRATTATDTLEFDDSNLDTPNGVAAPALAGTPTTGVASFLRVSQNFAPTASEPYRLFAVVQPPIGSAALEAEPNETPAQASHSAGNYLSGTLASPTDTDVYRLAAAAGTRVFVALDADPLRNNTPFNPTLTVSAANGDVVEAVNDNTATSDLTPGAGNLASTTPNSPAEATAFRAAAPGPFFVKVEGAGGSAGDYLLSISLGCGVGGGPELSLSPDGLPNATLDQPYSQALTASGGNAPADFTLADGTLPAGLTLGPDGTIAGTPTQSGAFPFTVDASDGTGALGRRGYSLTVDLAPPAEPPPPSPGEPPVSDQTPPETTITKDPPSKTAKTQVKYKFESSEDGSTFECKLDKEQYKACDSPRKLKRLVKGKHTFKVRAIDAAGNVDTSPAKDKFKVVEK